MIPRFSNPHLLPPSTEFTTRSQLFETDGTDNKAFDEHLAATLKELVGKSLGSLEHDGSPKRKKRKIATDPKAIPFRLLSSALPPQPVVLDPKPPPPSKIREPECEDDEDEADERAKRAKAAAIDMTWILLESKKAYAPFPSSTSKLLDVQAPLPATPAPIMIVEKTQPFRATRPPVHSSQLPGPPYTSDSPAISAPQSKSYSVQISSCSITDGLVVERRPHKKGREQTECPQPIFWRPESSWRGKCLGYAYGYPSSWAPEVPYTRDTIRKAVHIDPLE